MIPYQSTLLPSLILAAFLFIFTEGCDRSCGEKSVPYPFGFSLDCPIRLNCNGTADILLGRYPVLNFTSQSVLVSIPASCDRPMEDARALFGNNYAMTLRNGLFLRNCGPAASPCLVSSELISERLYLASCGHKGDNISCFSNGTTAGYLSEEFVTKINCTSLFTTARYNRIAMSQPELVFGEAEIGWWMDGGECQCSANATCTRATTTVPEKMGYRCACVPGFLGDGFVAGEGCRKVQVSRCSASKYISGRCAGAGLLVAGTMLQFYNHHGQCPRSYTAV